MTQNSGTQTIDTVIFDWGGTLVPWVTLDPLDAWQAYAAAIHAGDAAAAEALAATLVAADDARWARVRAEHHAFTLADVFADALVEHNETGVAAYRTFWEQGTLVDPEAAPMLAELRERGMRLGVLSSTLWPAEWHEEWLRRDGILEAFDACVWSSDLPYTKPHATAFHAAMDAVGATDPARCVYVGDRLYDDISGAKAVGMRAVLVPHSAIPEIQLVPTDAQPDAVIQKLSDLPDVIAGW